MRLYLYSAEVGDVDVARVSSFEEADKIVSSLNAAYEAQCEEEPTGFPVSVLNYWEGCDLFIEDIRKDLYVLDENDKWILHWENPDALDEEQRAKRLAERERKIEEIREEMKSYPFPKD